MLKYFALFGLLCCVGSSYAAEEGGKELTSPLASYEGVVISGRVELPVQFSKGQKTVLVDFKKVPLMALIMNGVNRGTDQTNGHSVKELTVYVKSFVSGSTMLAYSADTVCGKSEIYKVCGSP